MSDHRDNDDSAADQDRTTAHDVRSAPVLETHDHTPAEDAGAERTAPEQTTAEVVPGYVLLGELGQGGMGVVYKARHTKLNRVVALKMMLGGRAGRSDLIRFLAEAESVAAVKHENVVQVFDYGDTDGRPFMALEYLPGGSLADLFDKGKVSASSTATARDAARLLAQVARGVAAAHAQGIVHRDLKPANVLLSETGVPKVADFGLAKRGDGSDVTRTGQVMGTPAYMSPEQAKGDGKFVGPQADVWALGVIMYEALTGTRPFTGTMQEVLARAQTTDPAAPRKVVPTIPRDLELICLKCLSKLPHERYATAKELADDLDRYLAGLPVAVRPLGAVAQAVKWARRNPVLAALFVAIVVGSLLTAAASLVALRNARDRADAEAARVDAERDAANSLTKQLDAERGRAAEAEGRAGAERARAAEADRRAGAERDKAAETERRARAEREAAVARANQANDFKQVVELVEAAEREGVTLPPELQFNTASALVALDRTEEARKRLEALARRNDIAPELRARVELRLADELQGIDDERAAALFFSARKSGNLPPADVVYADAITTSNLPDAIKLLYKCLDIDPTYFYARRLIGVYLSITGRLDDAIRIGEENRLIFRDHPDVVWPLFLAYTFKGNVERTRRTLELLRRYTPERFHAQVELVADSLPMLNVAFKSALAGTPLPIEENLVKRLKAANLMQAMAAPDAKVQEPLTAWLNRFPKAARDGYARFWNFVRLQAQPGGDYVGALSGDEERLKRFKTDLDRHPEGFMCFVYALALMSRASIYWNDDRDAPPHLNRYRVAMKEVGDAYLVAANTPALIEIRSVALDGAILAYGVAAKPIWAKEWDRDAMKKARQALQQRLDYPEPLIPARYDVFVRVARNANDYTAARRLLDDWERLQPKNPQMFERRAEIEFRADAYLPALFAARKVLAKEPTHAAMRQMERDCLAKLREDPDAIAPPPRPK